MHKVMFTSLPSTGTHLMHNFFRLADFRQAEPIVPTYFDKSMWEYVRTLQEGYYSAWHYMWYQRLSDILRENEVRAVFLIRDPRAQACASVHHIMWNKKHPLHRIFSKDLKTFEERLIRVIEGMPPEEFETVRRQGKLDHETAGPTNEECKGPTSRYPSGLNSIHRLFSRWFDDPSCYCVKFEDLVGPHGGGDREKQLRAVRGLMDYTGVNPAHTTAEFIADGLFDTNTATFRKGRIDSWREEMSPALQEVFMRECGEILRLWGYDPEPAS